MMSGIMGTVVQGMAFGTGSAVANRAVDAVMGPRQVEHVNAAAPQAAGETCCCCLSLASATPYFVPQAHALARPPHATLSKAGARLQRAGHMAAMLLGACDARTDGYLMGWPGGSCRKCCVGGT